MKSLKSILAFATLLISTYAFGQKTAIQFSGMDCKNNPVNLFQDLDSGKVVVLHYFMAGGCTSCPPSAQRIQKMAMNLMNTYPGKVKGFAFNQLNSTSCSVASTWVTSNGLSSLYSPMDSGETDVATYGGFGMPSVVLLGGKDHRVLYFYKGMNCDTAIMKDSMIAVFKSFSNTGGTGAAINHLPSFASELSIYPNPTADYANITLTLKENADINIVLADLMGNKIEDTKYANQSGFINKQLKTSHIPSGMYILRISINGEIASQMLNIQH